MLSKSTKLTLRVLLPNLKIKGMIAKSAVSPMKKEAESLEIKIMVRAVLPPNPKPLL
jgi:hypothetical protein